jgi:hypothetical protein
VSRALDELLAKQEIAEVVARYCRAADRMDWELMRSCYHPDATDDHGSYRGSVDEFLGWAWDVRGRHTMTMHFIGNQLIELRGERAACETYGIAFHRGAPDKPHFNLVNGFRFLDRFERRGGGPWKIAARVVVTEWSRLDDEAGRWAVPEALLQGRRAPDDALYALFDWVRAAS